MTSLFKIFSVLIIGSALLFSCSIEKRLYNKGYSVHWNSGLKDNSKSNETTITNLAKETTDLVTLEPDISLTEEIEMTPETTDELPCDSIKLKNGETKSGIVQEIGISEIKYKNCDGSGPVYVVEKSSVKSIRYSNGTNETISTPEPKPVIPTPVADTRKLEGFGLAGFICSLVGILIATIPLSIAAMAFGIISIGRVVSYPNKFKGAAFGILSLIFGLVLFILALALLL